VPVHRRIAEVGRTSSGSEKRATLGDWVESPVVSPERVNGSLTIGGRSGAQAQEPIGGKRGADHRKLGDPHHVSAASSMKAARFRSCFGTGGMRVASVGGRHPGSAKRTPFTRPPRNRSWRPPSKRLELEEKRIQAHGTEEATGVSEAVGNRFHAAEENAIA